MRLNRRFAIVMGCSLLWAALVATIFYRVAGSGPRHSGTGHGKPLVLAAQDLPLGAVIGPIGLGAWFDRHGSYDLPLLVLPCMLLVAAGLVLSLGRYRVASHEGATAAAAPAQGAA